MRERFGITHYTFMCPQDEIENCDWRDHALVRMASPHPQLAGGIAYPWAGVCVIGYAVTNRYWYFQDNGLPRRVDRWTGNFEVLAKTDKVRLQWVDF